MIKIEGNELDPFYSFLPKKTKNKTRPPEFRRMIHELPQVFRPIDYDFFNHQE